MLQQSEVEPKAAPQERLWRVGTLSYTFGGLVVLFAWLLMGDFAWNARERAIVPLAQLMLKAGNASDTIVGIFVGSVPAAVGMLLSPIVGYRSDRCRSRLGRRIPFLLVSTPLAALAMVGLAFVPYFGRSLHEMLGSNSPGELVCFISCFSVFWLVFEVAAITGSNIFLALINDVVPTEVLGRFFGLFRIVSLGVGVGFNIWLLGMAEAYMVPMLLALALVYGVGFGAMSLRVKEGAYPLEEKVPEDEKPNSSGILEGIKRYCRECLYHPYFWWLFGVCAVANTAFAPVNSFALFYAKNVGLGLDGYGKALAVGFVLSLLISYPVGVLADKVHPLRIGIGALLLYLPLCIWGALCAKTAGTFGFAFAAHVVLSGLFFTGTASLGQRLYPKASFAQFSAAAHVVLGLLTMAVPPVVGLVLDQSGQQYRLTFAMSGILCFFATAGFLVLLIYFKRLGGDSSYVPPRFVREQGNS